MSCRRCSLAALFIYVVSGFLWGDSNASQVTIQVELQGGSELEGRNLYLALQNRVEFARPEGKPRYSISIQIAPEHLKTPFIELSFGEVEPGEYVISGFVDVNGNGRLNQGFFGPTEPWGMSNLKRPLLRRPNFEELTVVLWGENNKEILRIR